ncbi:thioredoxin family protein [Sulfurovum sp. XGS-02]|uniref:thioredoxin family protein n=1 Tax=Sulfurovum sp. XGS-02 TaxID=2925411 RepID=UPI00204F039E|nr:thioredoxin family protein [Sulfurovum sp. XGS-02]UPT78081.1 thioredoxin family protein [Sulfurovum sp. XGS-02]
MKKLIILLLMTLGLNASEITWFESYTKAAAVAKEENKPMLLFINRPGCGACEFMKENVFTDKMIYTYVNEHFIPVSLDINKNDAPKDLQSEVTPTYHFVKYDGTKIRETLFGGKTGKFYLNILKDAVAAYK